jgi:SAM-dependent methyltransferase
MSDAAALVPNQGPDYAAALAAPPLTNLRRIGGEMFSWTDSDPGRGPARPHGAVLRHLAGSFAGPGRSVLIAGPHADDLAAGLVEGGATVTWLLRSLVDAEATGRAHPEVTVLAGAAIKLDPAEQFDLVVALDGVERLNSSEGEQMSAGELLDRLAEAVRPGGVLLLMHDNRLGVHHTVRLEPGGRERDDAAWYPIDDHDTERPASAGQLADRLTRAGLTVDTTYAAFPEPAEPTVLVGPGLLGAVASPLRPRLGTALSQAFAAGFRGRAVLSDPRRLVERALRAGAEGTVAPSWLVIARSGAAPAAERPDLLIGDPRGTFAYEIGLVDGEVRSTVLEPLAEPVERDGLRRIAEPLAPGADTGYVLEERLLHLCATAGLSEMRAELSRYASWLATRATGDQIDGPAALAGLADVFVTPGGPALLPTRWAPIEPVALETALVRSLWEFAVQLITSGRPHPWPITSSAADLTAILLGMVGHGVADGVLAAAVELHVTLEAAEFELSLEEQQARRLLLLAVTPGTGPIDIPGYRELTEALWRQRYQASHLLAMMEWTEQIIESRDNTLSKMDREVQFYRSRMAGKMLVVAKEAYRVVARDGRKLVRRRRG